MTKYAVIQTGGKQYRVAEGDVIDVELLKSEKKEVEFEALFFNDGKDIQVGAPILDLKVQGEVLGPVRGPKVIAYKYKKRKSSHRKVGHRQDYLRVKIVGFGGVSTPAAEMKEAAPKKAAAKKAATKKVAAKKAAPKKAVAKKKAGDE